MRPQLFMLLLLSATSSSAQSPNPRGAPRTTTIFVSPMGEPFRGAGDLVGRWFAGADRNDNGTLTLAEFKADAARFFGTLDGDRDGRIGPSEMSHYETVVVPELRTPPGTGGPRRIRRNDGPGGSQQDGSPQRRIRREPGGARRSGPASLGFFDLPQPVMAADSDFNRQVSKAEFDAAAADRFDRLDTNHDGALTVAELPRQGEAPRSARTSIR